MRPAFARLALVAADAGTRCRLDRSAQRAFAAACETALPLLPDSGDPSTARAHELGRALISAACVHCWLRRTDFSPSVLPPGAAGLLDSLAAADPLLLALWQEASRIADHDQQLQSAADALLRWHEKRADPSGFPSPRIAAAASLYEGLLAAQDKNLRKRRGVFYTPWPLATLVVRSIDEALRTDCGVAAGLGDSTVSVLDPGCGSAIFLAAIVHQASASGGDLAELLPRLRGVEILPAAWSAAHWVLGLTLAEAGFQSQAPLRLPLDLCDLFAAPPTDPPTVVLGNPPFAGNSASGSKWIEELLHGRGPGDQASLADYYSVAGEPLAERKHWLHDDYVKFFRYAHWQIERAGWGIVGLVTNHGYLDNTTFRGLRHSLAATFPRIAILDLHGNAKRRERTPEGGPDRNLFGIEQGVAAGLFVRPPADEDMPTNVTQGDLWGEAADKLAALAGETLQTLATTPLLPAPPHWRWTARDHAIPAEYASAWRLNDAMPVSSTAVVTARDGLVIADTREELLARIAVLRDPTISDDEIRARWLRRQRSPRHRQGNTRGWDLTAARATLRADEQWQEHVIPVAYRPFDRRYLYYSPAMVDWRRSEVMQHLLPSANDSGHPNLALVARRQSPAGEPACYFWAADGVVVDGLIRSDNCGSESVFPLFLLGSNGQGRQANFAPEFLRAAEEVAGEPARDPRLLAAYCYALFFSPEYRRRYAPLLATDFPRILLPRGAPRLFPSLATLGQSLLHQHLAPPDASDLSWHGELDSPLASAFPRWCDGRLDLSSECWIEPAPAPVWSYRVGTHQVCRKWIRDRGERLKMPEERTHLLNLLSALARTNDLELAIDQAISDHGGWAVFG